MTSTPVALASVLGARADGSARAETARGLLMTVLGEFVLPNQGQVWTQTVVSLMEQLGVRDKATRQALARMEDQDWLQRTRHGRQTRWHLTNHATDVLRAGAARIYGFGQHEQDWDRHWVVLLASVPEAERQLRSRMATGLNWAGFGSLGQGVWVSPWPAQEAAAVTLLRDLEIEATTFVATVGQLGSAESLARQGWDLPGLEVSYRDFLADTDAIATRHAGADGGGPVRGAISSGIAAASELAGLVHRWRRFPFLDPELPSPILPSGWPRDAAVQRFRELRAMLSPAAAQWWSTIETRA